MVPSGRQSRPYAESSKTSGKERKLATSLRLAPETTPGASRITLPAEVKAHLKVGVDDYVTFELRDDKSVVVRKATVTVH